MTETELWKAEMLDQLQRSWAEAHPKRAPAGADSISGFSYQYLVVLRDMVRAWLKDPTEIPPMTETLSDLVKPGADGMWTITQMKKTGTSSSLAKALEELWTIDAEARRSTPKLLPFLRYETGCEAWKLQDSQASIDRWKPKGKEEATQAKLEAFRGRVFVSSDSHPKDDLVVLLANDLRASDPLSWIHEWVGKLVSARDPKALALDIYNSLTALRNVDAEKRLPDGLRLIPPDLAEPRTTKRGQYLVGEQPRLMHHRKGWFAPPRVGNYPPGPPTHPPLPSWRHLCRSKNY